MSQSSRPRLAATPISARAYHTDRGCDRDPRRIARRARVIAAFLGGLLASVVIASILVIWSIRRHRDPDLHIECGSSIHELMPTLAGLTLGTTMAGNGAEAL